MPYSKADKCSKINIFPAIKPCYRPKLLAPSFVLDTPRYLGSHQTADSRGLKSSISSTGISPLRGSPATALIACDGLVTARTVTGQEYHYPFCLSSPYWKLSNIYSRRFIARPLREVLVQPLTWLMLITMAKGMCLMNVYSIFK